MDGGKPMGSALKTTMRAAETEVKAILRVVKFMIFPRMYLQVD
jgi:hypothetical protein